MYAFLLVVCTTVHSGIACLPAQRYSDLATCRAVGETYRRAGAMISPYSMNLDQSIQARCVRITA